MGQHGFARSTVWKFDSVVMDNETGVSVRLGEITHGFNKSQTKVVLHL